MTRCDPNSFAIVTLGCKVNQYESQALREGLRRAGMDETDPLDSPDIFLLNTCAVTAKSGADSRKWINRIRRKSPRATIVAVGCCVDIEPEAVAGADVVVPQVEKHALLEAVGGGLEKLTKMLAGVQDGNRKSNLDLEICGFKGHTRAFLKVQDGCNAGCSYCAIPIARGRSISRAVEAVLDEAARLSDAGKAEIVICGVNLGSYGRDLGMMSGLVRLLEDLLDAPGAVRFRLSSIEVTDVSSDLLALIASTSRICSHLHIPLQSGDAKVLEAMGRSYTPEQFVETVRHSRGMLDEPGITTDCMVAFPGETDKQFENTLAVCRECGFSRIHVFPFSPRPRTAAAKLPGRLHERTARHRARILIEEAETLAGSYMDRLVQPGTNGTVLDVVIEEDRNDYSLGLAARYVRARVAGSFTRGTRLRGTAAGHDGKYINMEVCDE